jgi:hypothetical protein
MIKYADDIQKQDKDILINVRKNIGESGQIADNIAVIFQQLILSNKYF